MPVLTHSLCLQRNTTLLVWDSCILDKHNLRQSTVPFYDCTHELEESRLLHKNITKLYFFNQQYTI